MKNLKPIKFASIFLFTLLVITGCLKDDTSPILPQAGFTMINLYSNANFIIHRADNNYIQTMNNPLGYKQIDFAYLYPGVRKIQSIDNQNKVLIDTAYTIKDSLLYTSFLFDKSSNKAGQLLVEDIITNKSDNNPSIRFLNFDKSKIVDVFFDNEKVFAERGFDGESIDKSNFSFIPKTAGKRKIIIKDASETKIAEKEFEFTNKTYYSIVFIESNDTYEILIYTQYKF